MDDGIAMHLTIILIFYLVHNDKSSGDVVLCTLCINEIAVEFSIMFFLFGCAFILTDVCLYAIIHFVLFLYFMLPLGDNFSFYIYLYAQNVV